MNYRHARKIFIASASTVAVISLVAALGGAALTKAPSKAKNTPTPPPAAAPGQPAPGHLGGNGPCGKGPTPTGIASRLQQVWYFQPSGKGTPRTGGTCSDKKRPVIFIAHGATAIIPLVYQEMIDNMVSNGYIVVYTNQTLLWKPELTYPQVAEGAQYAVKWLDMWAGRRMDLDNIGIWGHSSGGGMVPWLAQQAEKAGWGRQSMWLYMAAPYFAFKIETEGKIHLPANARVQVVNFDQDDKSDASLGIDLYKSFDLPESQKTHIMVNSDGPNYIADHGTVKSWAFKTTPSTFLAFYGVWRNYQAMGDCARFAVNCNADLTYMGTWSDGREAKRASISTDPIDIGPPALDKDCTFFEGWEKNGKPHLCKVAPRTS